MGKIVKSVGKVVGNVTGLGAPSTKGLQQSAANATQLQERMYNEAIERGEPFYDTGVAGVDRLRNLAGLGENPADVQAALEADPSYQFRLGQGQQAVDRALAAQGKTLDPEYARALSEYNQGFASNEYGNLFNRLSSISGMGQAQQGQMAGLGQDYASNVGNIGTSLAQSLYGAKAAQAARQADFFGNIIGAASGGMF